MANLTYSEENLETTRLFKTGFARTPTIILLRKERYYKYQGEIEIELLKHFATESFDHEDHFNDLMPVHPTFWNELKHMWAEEVNMKGGLMSAMLMKDREGRVHYSALLMVYGMPLLSVYIFYKIMMSSFSTEDDIQERTKVLEIKNEVDRRALQAHLDRHNKRKPKRKW